MAGPIMKQLQCAIEKDICLQEKDWELLRLPCSVSNFPEKKKPEVLHHGFHPFKTAGKIHEQASFNTLTLPSKRKCAEDHHSKNIT